MPRTLRKSHPNKKRMTPGRNKKSDIPSACIKAPLLPISKRRSEQKIKTQPPNKDDLIGICINQSLILQIR
jgi:hypothetical protein